LHYPSETAAETGFDPKALDSIDLIAYLTHIHNSLLSEIAMTKLCRGCGEPLTSETDSDAHVIPQALGGRLAPRGIICRTCNGILNDAADLALVEAFGAWPTLFDIPRQDGKNPPKKIETRKGYQVRLEASGKMTRTDVVYDVTNLPKGQKVEIGAGNMTTARQLLARAAKQFPGFDIAEAEKRLKVMGLPMDDEIKLRLDYSPEAVFGGVVAAIWLYLIHTTGRAFLDLNGLLTCIKKMQTNGGTFRYLIDGLPGLKGPDIDLGHKVIVRSVPSTGELIAYVEVMGVVKVGGVFASGSDHFLEHIYAYDLSTKADRSNEFSIDAAVFQKQDWRKVGLGTDQCRRVACALHQVTKRPD
jgi:hypothetical protein